MPQTRQTRIISELRQRPASTETVVPFIRIRGRWLENAGFEIGDDVQIEVRDHQLILTKVTLAGMGESNTAICATASTFS